MLERHLRATAALQILPLVLGQRVTEGKQLSVQERVKTGQAPYSFLPQLQGGTASAHSYLVEKSGDVGSWESVLGE